MAQQKMSVSAFLIIQQNTQLGSISKHLAGNKIANGLRLPFWALDARATGIEVVSIKEWGCEN